VSKNDKKQIQAHESGWMIITGNVDISAKEGHSARFLSPMSVMVKTVDTKIKPEKRYEIGYDVATDSTAGFLSSTVTFLKDNGKPVGKPTSAGVKLSTLAPDSYSPVSYITGPAPKEAVKAQLTFTVYGAEYNKKVDINKLSFKESR